jgi:hypothetical protein
LVETGNGLDLFVAARPLRKKPVSTFPGHALGGTARAGPNRIVPRSMRVSSIRPVEIEDARDLTRDLNHPFTVSAGNFFTVLVRRYL